MNSAALQHCLALACVSLCLSGCLGGSATVRPEAVTRSESLVTRALRAEQKHDVNEAERLLGEALAISASIEDTPATAHILINQARLYRLYFTPRKAATTIDAALALITADSVLFSEAAHEKALVDLASNSLSSAQSWAERAVSAEKGDSRGQRMNLLGRILIARSNPVEAERQLTQALKENRRVGDSEEEANSLRMLGISAGRQGRYAEGEALLQEALLRDKQLARSAKIAADLEELSRLNHLRGDIGQSIQYLQRASTIHRSAGRLRQAAENQTQLADLYQQTGNAVLAEQARALAKELSSNTPPYWDTIKPSSKP